MERIARHRGRQQAEPDFSRYQAPGPERVPVGEVFNGNYLRRTVVFLVGWVLVYMGIDGGFSPNQGGGIVDKGWSADNLFPMILIGGAWRREE